MKKKILLITIILYTFLFKLNVYAGTDLVLMKATWNGSDYIASKISTDSVNPKIVFDISSLSVLSSDLRPTKIQVALLESSVKISEVSNLNEMATSYYSVSLKENGNEMVSVIDGDDLTLSQTMPQQITINLNNLANYNKEKAYVVAYRVYVSSIVGSNAEEMVYQSNNGKQGWKYLGSKDANGIVVGDFYFLNKNIMSDVVTIDYNDDFGGFYKNGIYYFSKNANQDIIRNGFGTIVNANDYGALIPKSYNKIYVKGLINQDDNGIVEKLSFKLMYDDKESLTKTMTVDAIKNHNNNVPSERVIIDWSDTQTGDFVSDLSLKVWNPDFASDYVSISLANIYVDRVAPIINLESRTNLNGQQKIVHIDVNDGDGSGIETASAIGTSNNGNGIVRYNFISSEELFNLGISYSSLNNKKSYQSYTTGNTNLDKAFNNLPYVYTGTCYSPEYLNGDYLLVVEARDNTGNVSRGYAKYKFDYTENYIYYNNGSEIVKYNSNLSISDEIGNISNYYAGYVYSKIEPADLSMGIVHKIRVNYNGTIKSVLDGSVNNVRLTAVNNAINHYSDADRGLSYVQSQLVDNLYVDYVGQVTQGVNKYYKYLISGHIVGANDILMKVSLEDGSGLITETDVNFLCGGSEVESYFLGETSPLIYKNGDKKKAIGFCDNNVFYYGLTSIVSQKPQVYYSLFDDVEKTVISESGFSGDASSRSILNLNHLNLQTTHDISLGKYILILQTDLNDSSTIFNNESMELKIYKEIINKLFDISITTNVTNPDTYDISITKKTDSEVLNILNELNNYGLNILEKIYITSDCDKSFSELNDEQKTDILQNGNGNIFGIDKVKIIDFNNVGGNVLNVDKNSLTNIIISGNSNEVLYDYQLDLNQNNNYVKILKNSDLNILQSNYIPSVMVVCNGYSTILPANVPTALNANINNVEIKIFNKALLEQDITYSGIISDITNEITLDYNENVLLYNNTSAYLIGSSVNTLTSQFNIPIQVNNSGSYIVLAKSVDSYGMEYYDAVDIKVVIVDEMQSSLKIVNDSSVRINSTSLIDYNYGVANHHLDLSTELNSTIKGLNVITEQLDNGLIVIGSPKLTSSISGLESHLIKIFDYNLNEIGKITLPCSDFIMTDIEQYNDELLISSENYGLYVVPISLFDTIGFDIDLSSYSQVVKGLNGTNVDKIYTMCVSNGSLLIGSELDNGLMILNDNYKTLSSLSSLEIFNDSTKSKIKWIDVNTGNILVSDAIPDGLMNSTIASVLWK